MLRTKTCGELNNSNISAIVEDISKKNEGKYYGN